MTNAVVAWLPCLPVGCLLWASVCDLRTREIPHWIAPAILVGAAASTSFGGAPASWSTLATGVATALALALPLYLLGGVEAGDVKLLAALGGWLGPLGLLAAAFWIAIFGAAASAIAWARRRRELPYVPAITAGFCLQLWWPAGISRLLDLLAPAPG